MKKQKLHKLRQKSELIEGKKHNLHQQRNSHYKFIKNYND